MFAIASGIVLIAFTIFACLPGGLGWNQQIILFLKGASPVVAALVGLVAILVGIADLRDRREAKLEELEALRAEQADS